MAYSPHVTVIIPVYNAESSIDECIRSLLMLDYKEAKLEFIFVDNASTDQTAAILKSYAGDARVRILKENKRGPAAARNKGLLHARNDIVAFTDSDCVVEKDWLTEIVSPLADERVGIVGGKILATPEANEIEKFGEEIHDHDKAINLYEPPYAITMNWSSRLSVLQEADLFDENLIRCEDVDLSQRILQSGYKLVFSEKAIIYHRNESTLKGLFREGFAHGFYSVQVLKKHRALIKTLGQSRFHIQAYFSLLESLSDYLQRKNPRSICYFAFNVGKKIGKILGSVRFFYVDL